MTHCKNCKTYLGTNRDITKHLESVHDIHVRLGDDSHLAYCDDCHKYLGKKKGAFNKSRQALEKHLHKCHNVEMEEGSMPEE
mmetsp:Transcript_32066/g.39342  ORF Transcript_32066/g.39342 Transcript_32066/m.39342 type:complete len:82 (-) Transcript_32066:78-323(-)